MPLGMNESSAPKSDKAPTAAFVNDLGHFITPAAPAARAARAERKGVLRAEFEKKREAEEQKLKRRLTYEEEAKIKIDVKEALEWAGLSPTEKKVHKLFSDYDRDNNKRLSVVEFKKILAACGVDRSKANKMFELVDANGDGQLMVAELVQWMLHGSADSAIFAHMNRPIDAKEAAAEFMSFINDLARCSVIATEPEDLAGKCFVRDHDKIQAARKAGHDVQNVKTRVLNEDEKWMPFEAIFDEMDANSNGFISMNELVVSLQTYGFDCHRTVIEKMFRLLDENEEQREKKFGAESVTNNVTRRLKDHALDMVEFLEMFGKEITPEYLAEMPAAVQEKEAQRKDVVEAAKSANAS
jgi:Ca2+-binding EF-hand superfamily protein